MSDYAAFLAGKAPKAILRGLPECPDLAGHLFPFQRDCVDFGMRAGSWACFLDTGLGKTAVELEWAEQARLASNGWALILTPLAVARQIEAEGKRWGYDVRVIREQEDAGSGINICNYDRLEKLDADRFGVVALDESSILKSFTGKTCRALIAAFAGHRWRMAATATPAPNDHMELGQHAEFLGVMASNEMLARWFLSDQTEMGRYRLKGHGRQAFWDWLSTWARMAERPEDLGDTVTEYVLPKLDIVRHRPVMGPAPDPFEIRTGVSATEMFALKRRTVQARADVVEGLVNDGGTWVVWCDTNFEADEIKRRMNGDTVEVRGSDLTEVKESRLEAFRMGLARVIVTKPSIAGHGLNWQHCAQMVFAGRTFSYEAWYQAVRRCWRFGQKRPVVAHIVVADGEESISRVLDRKGQDHEQMKGEMVAAMRRSIGADEKLMAKYEPTYEGRLPAWMDA